MVGSKIKALQINENDNFGTAFAKGGIEGLIDGVIIAGAFYGAVYLYSKNAKKKVVTVEEDKEA